MEKRLSPISFEFFPPKTPKGSTNLHTTLKTLAQLQPDYFSVTYGAGGSTQERTLETVLQVKGKTHIDTAPHISCISSSPENITQLLNHYQNHDITHLVVLRGDLPSGMGPEKSKFHYAKDLVAFIREKTGAYFHIEVAAYPEFHPHTNNAQLGLKYFKDKINAGANSAITQYFYNSDAYFRFLDSCEKLNITIPIIPGIMPITNYTQLAQFSSRCGAEIPRWLRLRLESFKDDLISIRQYGEEVVTELCRTLIKEGAPGLHFYTLNKATPSTAILKNLGFLKSDLETLQSSD